MSFLTLRFLKAMDDAARAGVDASLRARGGAAQWRTSERLSRTYALVELDANANVGTPPDATVYDRAIIALAVFPTVAEALPHVVEALAGTGRPAGVLSCTQSDGAAVVEWDPYASAPGVVFAVCDVELKRFASGRTVEILSPVPAALLAQVAAGGLGAPEISGDRVLEDLLTRAGLASDA